MYLYCSRDQLWPMADYSKQPGGEYPRCDIVPRDSHLQMSGGVHIPRQVEGKDIFLL